MQHTSEQCRTLLPQATISRLWDISAKSGAESCIFVLTTHTLVDDKAQDILILADGEASHQTVIGLRPVDLTVEVTCESGELTMELLPTGRAIREFARARRRSRFAARRRKLHQPASVPVPAESRC